MSKLFHISDPHMSFVDETLTVVKHVMKDKVWAQWSDKYVDYLEKIAVDWDSRVSSEDIVAVTGDILHNMKQEHIKYACMWLAKRPGIKVLCKGNHDFWSIKEARALGMPGIYFLDNFDVLNIKGYQFVCFSINLEKEQNQLESYSTQMQAFQSYLATAQTDYTKRIWLSHYPPSYENYHLVDTLSGNSDGKSLEEKMHAFAEAFKLDVYLFGHIHTDPLMEWFDKACGKVNNKEFSGVSYYLSTTDYLQNKLRFVCELEDKKFTSELSKIFDCEDQWIKKFKQQDPWNPQNELQGYICKKKGRTGGSLYITHINGQASDRGYVQCTPKLAYPYASKTSRDLSMPDAVSYLFMEKWNGMNVLAWQYEHNGQRYTTFKSKGTVFLKDGVFGNFATLLQQVPDWKTVVAQSFHSVAEADKFIQISFELCGNKEPHLVKYDFDILLKPLFYICSKGIVPLVEKLGSGLYWAIGKEEGARMFQELQEKAFMTNEIFRKQHGTKRKYEYEQFAMEGYVMYPLNGKEYVEDMVLYKCKPIDIEELHWQQFDGSKKALVDEALLKLKENGQAVTAVALQEELDMGPKEWSKFGESIMQYLSSGRHTSLSMVLLVGLPGSGKSTWAQEQLAVDSNWVVINQDASGSRKECKRQVEQAFKSGRSVIIDRCNHTKMQRKTWIDLAKTRGGVSVYHKTFDTPPDVCIARAQARTDHPTIKDPRSVPFIVSKFKEEFEPIAEDELLVDYKTNGGQEG